MADSVDDATTVPRVMRLLASTRLATGVVNGPAGGGFCSAACCAGDFTNEAAASPPAETDAAMTAMETNTFRRRLRPETRFGGVAPVPGTSSTAGPSTADGPSADTGSSVDTGPSADTGSSRADGTSPGAF